jgi:hypothetical protein
VSYANADLRPGLRLDRRPALMVIRPRGRMGWSGRRGFFLLFNNNIFFFINGNRVGSPWLSRERK